MTLEFAEMLTGASDGPMIDADRIAERTRCRIEQYRHHIESMEQDGRESEGAVLVMARLQRVAIRLQLYRKLLQYDRPLSFAAPAGNTWSNRSLGRGGLRPSREIGMIADR